MGRKAKGRFFEVLRILSSGKTGRRLAIVRARSKKAAAEKVLKRARTIKKVRVFKTVLTKAKTRRGLRFIGRPPR